MTFDFKYIFEKFLFLWNSITCKYDYATHRSDRHWDPLGYIAQKFPKATAAVAKHLDLKADHSRSGL